MEFITFSRDDSVKIIEQDKNMQNLFQLFLFFVRGRKTKMANRIFDL
jgi:hypothetical protein